MGDMVNLSIHYSGTFVDYSSYAYVGDKVACVKVDLKVDPDKMSYIEIIGIV